MEDKDDEEGSRNPGKCYSKRPQSRTRSCSVLYGTFRAVQLNVVIVVVLLCSRSKSEALFLKSKYQRLKWKTRTTNQPEL